MAIRYYDDILIEKLKKWLPTETNLRVLKPDESNRFYKLHADDENDNKFKLPLITVNRSKDLALLSNIKQSRSFDGLKVASNERVTIQMNIIPILPTYQLDIFTKTYEEGDEYVRNFLFKLINNPKLIIEIPYNNTNIKHVANIRVLETVSDTSDIAEHLFPGQFTRWTIQLEIQDAFLFSIPYKDNWKFIIEDVDDPITAASSALEVTENLNVKGVEESISVAGPVKNKNNI